MTPSSRRHHFRTALLLALSACGGQDPGARAGGNAGPVCRDFVKPSDCSIPSGAVLPGELRCTGLYADFEARELSCGVQAYTPTFVLWSDGAVKQRYVSLPEGSTIDVSEPDAFVYPVGTRFWKEFALEAPMGLRRAETRLLEKSEAGWIYTTYVWSADQTTAVQTNDGVPNLDETGHTVPSRVQCKECHAGRADYVLGWDALMLGDGATGLNLATLEQRGLLTWNGQATGAPSPLSLTVPGEDADRAALGYLHANCGVSCHNGTSPALARETGFFTRLDAGTLASVAATAVVTTGTGRPPSPNAPLGGLPEPDGGFFDLVPANPEQSLLLARMKVRGIDAQMPRVATNVVNPAGVEAVEAWILGLTRERGF